MLLQNKISSGQISSKARVRRQEIAFPSSRNPKDSRRSMPSAPMWFVVSPVNVRTPPPLPPPTFTSGYDTEQWSKLYNTNLFQENKISDKTAFRRVNMF